MLASSDKADRVLVPASSRNRVWLLPRPVETSSVPYVELGAQFELI